MLNVCVCVRYVRYVFFGCASFISKLDIDKNLTKNRHSTAPHTNALTDRTHSMAQFNIYSHISNRCPSICVPAIRLQYINVIAHIYTSTPSAFVFHYNSLSNIWLLKTTTTSSNNKNEFLLQKRSSSWSCQYYLSVPFQRYFDADMKVSASLFSSSFFSFWPTMSSVGYKHSFIRCQCRCCPALHNQQ